MTTTVLTANNAAWAWPANVTTIVAEAVGAGGGGGGVNGNPASGGGGAGGGYAKATITKGAESTLAIIVGVAGTAGAGATAATAGGFSSIRQGGANVVVATGGAFGLGGTASSAYAGGTVANCNGTLLGATANFAGGAGSNGTIATTFVGGGSGGAAGPGGVGEAASCQTAGVGNRSVAWFDGNTTRSGNGRLGAAANVAGAIGNIAGGGGSGGMANAATNRAGAAGFRGEVVLTYIGDIFLTETLCAVTTDAVSHTPTLNPVLVSLSDAVHGVTGDALSLTPAVSIPFSLAESLRAVDIDAPAVIERFGDFDSSRAAIVAALVSAQSETHGWNADVIAALNADLTKVVRTSDTVVTITLPAVASYNITSNETITITLPVSVLATSTSQIVASPAFVVTEGAATATFSKSESVTAICETPTVNVNPLNVSLLDSTRSVTTDAATAQLANYVASLLDAVHGVDSDVPTAQTDRLVSLVDSTRAVDTDAPTAQRDHNISLVDSATTVCETPSVQLDMYLASLVDSATASELPAISFTDNLQVSVADTATASEAATLQRDHVLSLVDSLTASDQSDPKVNPLNVSVEDSVTDADVIAADIPVEGDVSVSDSATASDSSVASVRFATFDDARAAIVNGLVSAQAEEHGWNADVITALLADLSLVVRTDDVTVTITLPAVAAYNITAPETITVTVPSAAMQSSTSDLVATPTFEVAESADRSVSVEDASMIGDSPVLLVNPLNITAIDSLTTADVSQATTDRLTAFLTDSLTTQDSESQRLDQYNLSVVDSATAADAKSLNVNPLLASVTDAATVQDSRSLGLDVVQVLKTDAATFSDAPIAELYTAPPVTLSIQDALTAADSNARQYGSYNLALSDAVRASESRSIASMQIRLTESLTSTESSLTSKRSTVFDDDVRRDIILGLVASPAEPDGWNFDLRDALLANLSSVVRTNDNVVMITLPPCATYDIANSETVTIVVPSSALTSGVAILATPSFNVQAEGLFASLSEQVSASESRTVLREGSGVPLSVMVTDALTTLEAVSRQLTGPLNFFLTERTTVRDRALTWGEWSSTGEFTTTDILVATTTVRDSVSALRVDEGDLASWKADAAEIREQITIILDTLNIPPMQESATVRDAVNVIVGTLEGILADYAEVSDVPSASLDSYNVNLSEGITSADDRTPVHEYAIAKTDRATISDSISAYVERQDAMVEDIATVSDAAYALLDLTVYLSDGLRVTSSSLDMTRPSAEVIGGDLGNIITPLSNAYDNDKSTGGTTYADAFNAAGGSLIYYGFNPKAFEYGSARLFVNYQIPVNAFYAEWDLRYSLDGGSSWSLIYNNHFSLTLREDVVTLPAGYDPTLVQVRFYVSAPQGAFSLRVNEIWIEGRSVADHVEVNLNPIFSSVLGEMTVADFPTIELERLDRDIHLQESLSLRDATSRILPDYSKAGGHKSKGPRSGGHSGGLSTFGHKSKGGRSQ